MSARCEVLADALGETIAELRLIDAGDMIGYIRAEQWANIADLVQSSAELSLYEGTVTFGYAGDYLLDWGDAPTIMLDMEFQSGEVTAFFTLTIAERESEIRIKDVLFGAVPADEHAATQTFARALAAARRDAGLRIRAA